MFIHPLHTDSTVQVLSGPDSIILSDTTVAPLTFPVQEVSSSSSQITIEMHMHDGPAVGHYMGDNIK